MALAWLKERAEEFRKEAADAMKRFKNQKMLDAITAACAWIAYADGSVSGDEKRKMMAFLQASPELTVFDVGKRMESYGSISKIFEQDFDFGAIEAASRIGKIKGEAGASYALVRVACLIGASDGNFDPHERKIAREICGILDVDPGKFDLGD